jgi:ComF family protein
LTVVRASFEFDGHVRAAIHRVKYRGESARAAWCATEMTTLLSPSPDRPDAICAVPLAPNRRRRRGFNQSEVIGRALAKQVGLSYLDALERVRDTAPQVGLTAEERYLNVQNAFRAVTSLEGIHLGLVDDVLTTGATMRACAQAARQAGAARVTGLVLATDVWTGSAT